MLIKHLKFKAKETKVVQLPKKLSINESIRTTKVKSVRLKSTLPTGLINIIYAMNDNENISIDHIDPHQYAQKTSKFNKLKLKN